MDSAKIEELEREFPQRIAEVKSILKAKHNIHVPDSCDEFVKRCLRTKDFHREKTVSLIAQFHSITQDMKEWDIPMKPSLYKQFYYDVCQPIPGKDSAGRRLCIVKPAAWDPSEYTFQQVIVILWTLAQFANIEYIENQRLGNVFIWDMTGLTWKHALAAKHRYLLSIVMWVQNGVLCRMKAFHIIFHPKVVSFLYSVVKPFLKEKIKNRIIFHNYDLDSLHRHVDPQLLPPSLGGSALPDVVRDTELLDRLCEQDAFFEEWLKVGFPSK